MRFEPVASRAWIVLGALVILALGVGAIFKAQRRASPDRSSTSTESLREASGQDASPALEVRLVEPKLTNGELPSAVPGHEALLTYELRNTTAHELHGLSPRMSCSCQAVGAFPERIGAGGTARAQFRFRAPPTGVAKSAIFVVQGDDTVGAIYAEVRADVTPPYLASEPSAIDISAIRGSRSLGQFMLLAVESAESPNWIEAVATDAQDMLATRIEAVNESPATEATTVWRRYLISIEPPDKGTEPGVRKGLARASFRATPGGSRRAPLEIPLSVRLLDPVALSPARVTLRPEQTSVRNASRIRVIWRTGAEGRTLAVHTAPEWATVEVENSVDGTPSTLLVSVAGGLSVPYSGEIVLAAPADSQVMVRLPVHVAVAEAE